MKKIRKISAAVLAVAVITAGGNVKADGLSVDTSKTTTVTRSADAEYVYCVGSVSKMYSTTAIMQLADEGKIDIEKPVTEYIPDFRMADERYKDITVHMLMNHTSGLMGSSWKNSFLYDDNEVLMADSEHNVHDMLLENLSTQRLKADPGKFAAYCNDGFVLMEIIVENVSGMSFTDYIRENISGNLGLENTGTAVDMLGNESLVPAVMADNTRLEQCYCMVTGTGGVYATASDNAKFGTVFFTSNDALLSEDAKEAMAARWSDSEFVDENGLGWDYAGMERYESNDVRVVGKGGDTGMDHAWLFCAPDEHISVSVLTSGGSSTYNALVSEAILDTMLAGRDINIQEEKKGCTTLMEIPEEYNRYAGWYIVNVMGEGDCLYHITFPGNGYMHIEKTTHRRTTCTDYLLTTDGDFAELAYEVEGDDFDTSLAPGYSRLSFEEIEDCTFLRLSATLVYPGLGSYDTNQYIGQMIEENNVSDEVINEYRELEEKALLLTGDKYTSGNYEDYGGSRIYVTDTLRGYVFLYAHGLDTILKMEDADHLVSFKNIPSSSSRDLMNITIERDATGISGISCTNSLSFITDDSIPTFDASVKTVEIGDDAAWYNIADSIANCSVTVNRPENSAIYVYNKYGEVIYTSHDLDARSQIPMPKGGKVLFLGQSGDCFDIVM